MNAPPPTLDVPVSCESESWVEVGWRVYNDGKQCWRRWVEATGQAPGPPPRAEGYISTWYAIEETTGEELLIATVEHIDPSDWLSGPGTCYSQGQAVFSTSVDLGAEHCAEWYPYAFPRCDIPGTCPLPPEWIHESDAGPADAATDATGAAPVDAASTLDATRARHKAVD